MKTLISVKLTLIHKAFSQFKYQFHVEEKIETVCLLLYAIPKIIQVIQKFRQIADSIVFYVLHLCLSELV